ncbi:hypothetical protein ABBQ32_004496 [Trebouxia sp. C0010 RCD-2024]
MAMTSFVGGGDAFAPFCSPTKLAPTSSRGGRDMHLDVVEYESKFEIRADLPGMSKGDIQVHVDNDVVTVSVEKEDKRDDNRAEQGVRYHRIERTCQFVRRTVRMPETADLDQIKAKYDNGVLQLNIPKKEDSRSRQRIPVQ